MDHVAPSHAPPPPPSSDDDSAHAADAHAVASFQHLLSEEGQRLLAAVRDHDPTEELALATRLRRDHRPDLVSAALAQDRLRRRAAAKFGPDTPADLATLLIGGRDVGEALVDDARVPVVSATG